MRRLVAVRHASRLPIDGIIPRSQYAETGTREVDGGQDAFRQPAQAISRRRHRPG